MKEYVSYNELKHWGIKGMKWGHKKTQVEAIGDNLANTAKNISDRNVMQQIQDSPIGAIGDNLANTAEKIYNGPIGSKLINTAKNIHDRNVAKDPDGQKKKKAAKEILNSLRNVKITDINSIGAVIHATWTGVKALL